MDPRVQFSQVDWRVLNGSCFCLCSYDSDLLVCQTVPGLSVCVREVGQADLERVLVSEKERRKGWRLC